MTSSLLATAGDLVFGGDAGRFVKAWDQETGEVLWEQRLNAPIGGYPMTYELDGEQYLVIPTGYSNAASSISSAFPEIPLPTGTGNSIFVFKLPAAK
jgi:alcohol dehydrogenase (cytochrome c)